MESIRRKLGLIKVNSVFKIELRLLEYNRRLLAYNLLLFEDCFCLLEYDTSI